MLLQPGALALSDPTDYNIYKFCLLFIQRLLYLERTTAKAAVFFFCYKIITNGEKGLYIILARCNIQP